MGLTNQASRKVTVTPQPKDRPPASDLEGATTMSQLPAFLTSFSEGSLGVFHHLAGDILPMKSCFPIHAEYIHLHSLQVRRIRPWSYFPNRHATDSRAYQLLMHLLERCICESRQSAHVASCIVGCTIEARTDIARAQPPHWHILLRLNIREL